MCESKAEADTWKYLAGLLSPFISSQTILSIQISGARKLNGPERTDRPGREDGEQPHFGF
jgi:hypothetical protein